MRDPSPICSVCDDKTMPGAPLPLCSRCVSRAYRFALSCIGPDLCALCHSPIGVERPLVQLCPECANKVHIIMSAAIADGRPTRQYPNPAAVVAGTSEIVYYIAFGDRIKIGTTGNLTARLQALPHDEVLAIEGGGRDVEAIRHGQFHEARITGEWFSRSPDLLAHIEYLRSTFMQDSTLTVASSREY